MGTAERQSTLRDGHGLEEAGGEMRQKQVDPLDWDGALLDCIVFG